MAVNPGHNSGLSLGKVAKYCGVTRKTILRWVQEGLLRSFVLPSGHHRIEPEEVARFLRKHNMPVPAELGVSSVRKALICEDDAQIRRVIADILKRDFVIQEAANGVEACIKIGAEVPDLLVLDIRMPKMDGLAVCRHIRNDVQLSAIRIVVVSAHIDDATEEALEGLADRIVRKPFSPVELSRICREITGIAFEENR